MNKKQLFTAICFAGMVSSVQASSVISGEIDTRSYKFGATTINEIEANIGLSVELTNDIKTTFNVRSINESEYENVNTEKGTSLEEAYVTYSGIPNTVAMVGQMGIGTEFSNGENIKGDGVVVSTNIAGVNVTAAHFKNNNIPGNKQFDLDYIGMNTKINEVELSAAMLYSDRDYAYSEAIKTIAASTKIEDVNVSSRFTKTADANNDGSFTVAASTEIGQFKTTLAYNKGFIASSLDLNDMSTAVGFGVWEADATALDTDKVLAAVSTEVYGVKLTANHVYLNGFDSINTFVAEGKLTEELSSKVDYNHTSDKVALNLKYSF